MKKEMLINVSQPEECRIAIIEDGVLEELYVERTSQESYVGNIYKGRIVNIEPSIQAAFVDFGIGRNGFLHVSDVEPAYYRHLEGGRRNGGSREQRHGRGGRPSGRHQKSHRYERDDTRSRAPGYSTEETFEPAPEEAAVSPAWPVHESSDSPELPPSAAEMSSTDPERETLGFSTEREEPVGEQPGRGEARRGKHRGRGRGRRRERQDEVSDAATEQPPDAADTRSSETPREQDSEAPRARLMDSAERRTEAMDSEGGPERGGGGDAGEDDIFFPREESSQPDEADGDISWHEVEVEVEETRPQAASFAEAEELLEEEDIEEGFPAIDEQGDAESSVDLDEEEEPGPYARRPRQDDDYGFGRRSSRGDRRPRQGRRFPGRPGWGRPKPLIQDIFKRGQEVLVQVIKEGIGTKGPTLSTYISIAGRYLVLMPGLNRIGVSRKIADEEQRRRLREIMHELQPPKGLGFIIRTAGLDRNKKDLQRDLAYLSRLWKVIVGRIRRLKSPAEIYKESDMITRTIRDTFTSEIETLWVDEPTAYEQAREFSQIVMPRFANRIKLYTHSDPLFHKSGIEEEIARIQQRHVPLPNGGSLVIDQTEALVAIDVNSGNFRADNNNAEETAFQMNLIAAKEIARQLRLRDLGGVIVNDFIDMREEKHRREVERALREAVKRDRARTKILKISSFGLIEMTRQRIRPSLKRSVYQDCEHCRGTGQVKTCESMSIDVMRMLQLAAHRPNVHRIEIHVAQDVANYLLNKKRRDIAKLEEARGTQVNIIGWSMPPPEALEAVRRPGGPLPLPHPSRGVSPETLQFICYDNNNPPNIVQTFPYEEAPRSGRR
jgi:ribonuclease E